MTRVVVLALALLFGCSTVPPAPDVLTAGAATVQDATKDAFGQPLPNLSERHRSTFFVGNSFFNQAWVAAPASVESRDGLGPLFNVRSCSGCHMKDGRSAPPPAGEPFRAALLRVSVPGRGPHGEPVPDPVYGDQIQGDAIDGVPREADVLATYDTIDGAFADGEPYSLLRPRYRLEHLGFGAASSSLLLSPRVAPAMPGVGLLETIQESDLQALADPEDADRDGISGRVNTVWDVARSAPAVGRFGWKAEQPSVRQQAAGAFNGDMGITTGLFSRENHTAGEKPCEARPSGGSPEATPNVLDAVVLYARTLAVPARRAPGAPEVLRGQELFRRARCTACHVPSFDTGSAPDVPELSGQRIHPYTDLLLHDMGDGLADGRPTFGASGNEWRTAPLWGVGLVPTVNDHSRYLHDGRARNLTEAVLWHDGEARASKETFVKMSHDDRSALVAFVASL